MCFFIIMVHIYLFIYSLIKGSQLIFVRENVTRRERSMHGKIHICMQVHGN